MTSIEQWEVDRQVIRAMQRYGGGFIHALAEAFLHADANNRHRLKSAFPEYWSKYSEMASKLPKEEA